MTPAVPALMSSLANTKISFILAARAGFGLSASMRAILDTCGRT
jgi:hypothetical protein